MSRRRSRTGLLLASAAIAASAGEVGNAREAEDYLTERWYRLEVIIFERGAADATVRRMTEPEAYPFVIVPLTNPKPDAAAVPFAPAPVVGQTDDPFYSNRPPPLGLAGDCVAASWEPPNDWVDVADALPQDPCLPPPTEPVAVPGAEEPEADAEPATAPEPSVREIAARALDAAFAEHEATLFETSYRWQPGAAGFRNERRRLASRFDILAAGTWHQALPPRDQPQPLLVQIGTRASSGRFDIEGWIAVTAGRYVHFNVHLMADLGDGTFALVGESRRLRSGEVHYLDHPLLGILVRTERLEVPQALREQIEALDGFDQ